jgi:hypothetical protein
MVASLQRADDFMQRTAKYVISFEWPGMQAPSQAFWTGI